jgi:phage shock protein A
MGIFTRTRDIIGSNVNSILDRAENPEKMVRMMAREMEETVAEVKASCAGALATKRDVQRELDAVRDRAVVWGNRAQLAVEKGRDDLAREALLEKRRLTERTEALEREAAESDDLIRHYESDIAELQDKLKLVHEKQRMLVQRHTRAQQKHRAQRNLRKLDTSNAMMRFDAFESRVERMESEADLVNFGRKPTLEEEFTSLGKDEGIEQELAELKATAGAAAE